MQKTKYKLFIFGLIAFAIFSGASCNPASIKAEEKTANSNTTDVETKNSNANSPLNPKTSGNPAMPAAAASIAGNYLYNTIRDGEGYDNSLGIEDKGSGKLHVSLEGSYIYTIDDAESMHEASGEGEAQLLDNVAVAKIKDENDKICRVMITFMPNQATVKIPDACHFNIALDGVYKKDAPKSNKKTTADNAKMREISYSKLMDFVNDFDNHKIGDRYVITGVPGNKTEKHIRADEIGNTTYKNLFYLEENDDDGYTGNSLLTSAKMLDSLADNAKVEPATLHTTAVLIESNGEYDTYRMSFVTKIEGLSKNGAVIWTATGAEPTRLKFTH